MKEERLLVTINKREILDIVTNNNTTTTNRSNKHSNGFSVHFNTLPLGSSLNSNKNNKPTKNGHELNGDSHSFNNGNTFIPNPNRSSNRSIQSNSVNSTSLLNDSNSNSDNNINNNNEETTWIHELFQGILVNETKCLNCESVSSKDENFLDLSVDVEQNTSISHCLQEFSSMEMLCGECKYYCENCSSKQEAEKR
jgi:hypothetical protein